MNSLIGDMRFQNKVVLVTGASRGIGAACAHRFAREGAKAVVHYILLGDALQI